MGKKSSSTTKSTSNTVYGDTTTTNPYVTSQTTNKGTISNFNKGTTYDSINNFVNSNINNLLEQYLNPSLDSVTNQAKINSFVSGLNNKTKTNLENDIINPLSKRNMIRSSQATDLYKNLASNNSSQIAGYLNELLSTSQNDTSGVLNNLLQWYMNGYDILSDAQGQSLAASQGNSTSYNTQKSKSSSIDYSQIFSDLVKLATSKRV